jgi:hypothetical protein
MRRPIFTRELVELLGFTFYFVVDDLVLVVRIDALVKLRLFSELNPT